MMPPTAFHDKENLYRQALLAITQVFVETCNKVGEAKVRLIQGNTSTELLFSVLDFLCKHFYLFSATTVLDSNAYCWYNYSRIADVVGQADTILMATY